MDRVDQAKSGSPKDKTQKKIDKANEKTSTEEKPKEEKQDAEETQLANRKFFSKKKIREVEEMGKTDDD